VAGARKVYLASAAPPVRYPNVYRVDLPSSAELVASPRSEKEVEAVVGADWLIYRALGDPTASVAEENPALTAFDCSMFDGQYVTGDIDPPNLLQLEAARINS
jgi:amidophosphoribosyltransferase